MFQRTTAALPLLLLACQAPPPPQVPPLTRETVNSQLPARPLSQAVRAGNTWYFSGKLGRTEETASLTTGRIEAETRNIMESFRALFQEVGVEFAHVVKATVYLTGIQDFEGMNQVYGEYFPADPPARETVAVKELVRGAVVEISFVAVVPSGAGV